MMTDSGRGGCAAEKSSPFHASPIPRIFSLGDPSPVNVPAVPSGAASGSAEELFICEHCGRELKSKSSLARHVRLVHVASRPFKCVACSKAFLQNSDLRRHMRLVHEKERNFACPECDSVYMQSSDLKRHVANRHAGDFNADAVDVALAAE